MDGFQVNCRTDGLKRLFSNAETLQDENATFAHSPMKTTQINSYRRTARKVVNAFMGKIWGNQCCTPTTPVCRSRKYMQITNHKYCTTEML